MPDFQGARCQTCTFYLVEGDGETGVCRRFPPQIVILAVKTDLNGAVGDYTTGTRFPTMLPSGWCGEHREASNV